MHDMIKCPITSNMGTTHFYIEMTCYHLGTFEDFRDFLLIFFVLLYEGFNTIVALLYQSVKKKFTNTTRGPMFPSQIGGLHFLLLFFSLLSFLISISMDMKICNNNINKNNNGKNHYHHHHLCQNLELEPNGVLSMVGRMGKPTFSSSSSYSLSSSCCIATSTTITIGRKRRATRT